MASEKKEMVLLTEFVRENGFTVDDCTPPSLRGEEKNKNAVNRYEKLNKIIIESFSKEIQLLLNEKILNLSAEEKKNRRYWQQQLGSRRGRIKTALSRDNSTANEKLIFDIEKLMKNISINEYENENYFPKDEVLKLLSKCIKIIKIK